MKYKSSIVGNNGFTLIELIVAIAVFTILASFLLTIIDPLGQFQKADDAKRKSDLSQLQRSLETYYQDYGKYPASSGDDVDITKKYLIKDNTLTPITWGSSWIPYMNPLPKDPSPSKQYVYETTVDQQSYWIYASLDRGSKDPQACNTDGSVCSNAVSLNGPCGGVCNFGVSSPNTSP